MFITMMLTTAGANCKDLQYYKHRQLSAETKKTKYMCCLKPKRQTFLHKTETNAN